MKALVLASGGVDSTTCLGLAVNKSRLPEKQQNITEWSIFIWIWSRSSGTVTARC